MKFTITNIEELENGECDITVEMDDTTRNFFAMQGIRSTLVREAQKALRTLTPTQIARDVAANNLNRPIPVTTVELLVEYFRELKEYGYVEPEINE